MKKLCENSWYGTGYEEEKLQSLCSSKVYSSGRGPASIRATKTSVMFSSTNTASQFGWKLFLLHRRKKTKPDNKLRHWFKDYVCGSQGMLDD